MSFDLVPADLVLKIFHQLPLKDRVRLSGVNRLFRDVSMESIAKMKSLVVNDDDDDLESYLVWTQTLSSLLESCSPTLESIDVSSKSCPKSYFNALVKFCYPKLERLEVRVTYGNIGQIKMLISQNRNLRSVILYLTSEFEWPDNVVSEKMEELKIFASGKDVKAKLSTTLRSLIGKIPKLKNLMILSGGISPPELSQLLASIPSLEELYLDFCFCDFMKYQEVMADVPTWYLPKVTTLTVESNDIFHDELNLSPIFHLLPASFPRLESFTSYTPDEIMDQDIMALSQVKYLKELRLPNLITTKEEFSEIINALPLITVLEIQQLSDFSSSEEFIEFLTSTAAIFHRDLEIRISHMSVNQISISELENVLEEIENNGGPRVTHQIYENSLWICSISYKSLDG